MRPADPAVGSHARALGTQVREAGGGAHSGLFVVGGCLVRSPLVSCRGLGCGELHARPDALFGEKRDFRRLDGELEIGRNRWIDRWGMSEYTQPRLGVWCRL